MSENKLSPNHDFNPEHNHPEIPNPSPDFRLDDHQSPEGQPRSDDVTFHIPPEASRSASHQEPPPDSEARTWAMLAHLSVLLNLFSGFFGGIAAIIIYFIYKDRSRFVAYHAMQAFIFQSITWIGSGVIGGILIAFGSTLGFLIIPLLCLIPGFLILLLAPASVIYGIIAGVQVNNGEDFRYWQVGDWVRNILEP
jgi:uncharacterized protein